MRVRRRLAGVQPECPLGEDRGGSVRDSGMKGLQTSPMDQKCRLGERRVKMALRSGS